MRINEHNLHIRFFDRQYRSRLAAYKKLGYKVLKCRDYSGEYRLEQNISREKGCGEEVAAKCLQFIKVL